MRNFDRFMKVLAVSAFAAAGLLAAPLPAAATIHTFDLANHPDGNAADPKYGLRLDGLYSGDSSDIWTFDFDHADSGMTLEYDDAAGTVDIFGTVFGGRDVGGAYDGTESGLWTVDFNYSMHVSSSTSGDDLEIEVSAQSASNNGSITAEFSGGVVTDGDVFNLADKSNGSFSFRFNNTENHRLGGTGLAGPEVFVGWGWLNHGIDPGADVSTRHIAASDWLFTGRRVPAPATLALLGLSLCGLGLAARRRRG